MKRRLQQALLVEGKYDAARLANLVEGIILTTDGFAVFKDRAMQDLLKRTARACGLVILTDSDAAGFKIRHFVTGLVGAQYAYQAFIPALPGKERRKIQPGKEGLLGVEGVPDELILQALDTALAQIEKQFGRGAGAGANRCAAAAHHLHRPLRMGAVRRGAQRGKAPRLPAASGAAAAFEQKRARSGAQHALYI